MTWTAILVLAVGTYAMKAVGPLVVGNRAFPPRLHRVLLMVAVSLLAALVALQTLAVGDRLVGDGPLVAGVVVAGACAWRRAPFIVTIVAASVVTAALRLVG